MHPTLPARAESQPPPRAAAPRSPYAIAVVSLFLILLLAHALQAAGTLRLEPDPIAYLSIAAAAADGEGLMALRASTRYPLGYPAMLAALDAAGLGTRAVFVLLNVVAFALALGLAWALIRRTYDVSARTRVVILALTLLSYVAVKHSVMPVTEFVYMAASFAALLCLRRLETPASARRIVLVGLSLVFVAVAASVRTVAIVLLPAVLWAAIPQRLRDSAVERIRQQPVRVLAVAVVAGIWLAAGALAFRDRVLYFLETAEAFRYLEHGALSLVQFRLQEWGEMFINVPSSRVPAVALVVYWLVGAAAWGVLARTFWRRRGTLSSVDVYLLGYLAMLLLWPFYDARYWLPVFPLLAAAVIEQLPRDGMALRRLGFAYVLWFALTGAAALAFSTRLTLAGNDFFWRYQPPLRGAYAVALLGCELEGAEVRRDAVRVLLRYEPRSVHVSPVPPCLPAGAARPE